MIVIVCLDNSCGMLLNRRRLSQDRFLRDDMLNFIENGKIWLNAYSSRQFSAEDQSKLQISEGFLMQAGQGEFCFVENCALKPVLDKLEEIVVYRWNRDYPSDQKLDVDLSKWKLVESRDFSGFSHPVLTREVYRR